MSILLVVARAAHASCSMWDMYVIRHELNHWSKTPRMANATTTKAESETVIVSSSWHLLSATQRRQTCILTVRLKLLSISCQYTSTIARRMPQDCPHHLRLTADICIGTVRANHYWARHIITSYSDQPTNYSQTHATKWPHLPTTQECAKTKAQPPAFHHNKHLFDLSRPHLPATHKCAETKAQTLTLHHNKHPFDLTRPHLPTTQETKAQPPTLHHNKHPFDLTRPHLLTTHKCAETKTQLPCTPSQQNPFDLTSILQQTITTKRTLASHQAIIGITTCSYLTFPT